MLTKIRNPSTVEVGRGAKRRGCGSGRVKVATDNSASTKADADDYYEVLGLVIFSNSDIWFGWWENVRNKNKIDFFFLKFFL